MGSWGFCLMGRFPILSVEWSQPWKGHLKALYCDGLRSTLPPIPVFRLGYFHGVCTIVGPRSPKFSLIRFVNTFPHTLSFVSFCIYFILYYHCETALFPVQMPKSGYQYLLSFTHHRSVLDIRDRDSNYFQWLWDIHWNVINMLSVEMCVKLIILALKGFKLQRFKNLYLWIVFLCCPFASDC